MNELLLSHEEEASAGTNGFLVYLPSVLWQRRWWIAVPLSLGVIASIAALFLISPKYQANAVLLVQSASLPDEVIGSLDDSLIERRVAGIRRTRDKPTGPDRANQSPRSLR